MKQPTKKKVCMDAENGSTEEKRVKTDLTTEVGDHNGIICHQPYKSLEEGGKPRMCSYL